ncbi:MAG: flavodoxin domain-containing protein [Candidatus Thorarchaeota archaeon]
MKRAVIVYESKYGNTKQIGEAIMEGMMEAGDIDCRLASTGEIHTDALVKYDVIIFGCPNHNQAPSRGIMTFITRASIVHLKEKVGAAFDTYTGGNVRVALKQLEAKIQSSLHGVKIIAEGFSAKVDGRKGPLSEGEIQRAQEYGKEIGKIILA